MSDNKSPPYRDDVDPLVAARAEIAQLRRIVENQSHQIAAAEGLKYKLEQSEHLRKLAMDDLKAMETATLRYYAFASDEQIAAYAQQQPNEQAKKIADLTLRLRREMAGKMEIQAALAVLIQRMKIKVPAMSEAEFGARFG